MRRIYFLVPSLEITHKIVEELRAEGIEDRHIHILAKRDTPLEGLPEAGVSIKTDFLPAAERGVALRHYRIAGRISGLAFCRVCHCRRAIIRDYYGGRDHRFIDGRFGGHEFG